MIEKRMRVTAWLGAVAWLLLSGCLHRPTEGMCTFAHDAANIVSDRDAVRNDIDIGRYLYVRDLVVENVNYAATIEAITRANQNATTWVTAIYGIPESADFGIVHVAIVDHGCQVRFVRARSGDRIDFEIDEGSGRLRGCVIPEYVARPDIAAQQGQPNPSISISHPPVRFLLWKSKSDTCGSVVEGASNLRWWMDFVQLRFLET